MTADLSCRAGSGTSYKAHTRAYRGGALVEEGFDVARISDYLDDPGTVVWLDLLQPSIEDLQAVVDELDLHPLAVEDAVNEHQRPKLDRYDDHLFLSSYTATIEPTTAELTVKEIGAFITPRALVTVRKGDDLPVEPLVERWDASKDLAGNGVGFLLHGLLDLLVDGHFEAVQVLDEQLDELEEVLFDEQSRSGELQRPQLRDPQVAGPAAPGGAADA